MTQQHTAPGDDNHPVVLFDGGCPLCRREIAHYRRLRGAGQIHWVDVVSEPGTVARLGIAPRDAMDRFHVRDRDGRWHTGARAFAELWRHLPRYRVASRLLRASGLLPLADAAYGLFARWRLRRRCGAGYCGESGTG